MIAKKSPMFMYCLLSILSIIVLSGCGEAEAAKGAPMSLPDSIQIELDQPTQNNNKASVTLTKPQLILQLYQTVYALPSMPENLACTMEVGPHYTLTFRQKSRLLGTALARREGCRPVTISGETHDRQASAAFWSLLDQAMKP